MSSSDQEDLLLQSVTNYDFENDAREPVSFSELPIKWNLNNSITNSELKIYVRGNADGSLIYKPVKAWKFDISGPKPDISVLCKDNNWVKLLNPRKSFEEECIRSILVTINFLHLVKRNPELPGSRVWKKLSNIFRRHDTKPSLEDLEYHRALIEHAMVIDESLKKSKCFMAVIERDPHMKLKADEEDLGKRKSQFVVNDDYLDDIQDDSEDEKDGSDDEKDDEAFDSVCAICDEGGPLLCCEGNCMRSFHATLKAGKSSNCCSLGFTEKKLKEMTYFKCQNCEYKLHQCFACGKLGSSDKQADAEVFQCVNATCGYFYHPHCVAKLLDTNKDGAIELEEIIRVGESFTCPLHFCFVCKHVEDKSNPETQMAVCRRCPKAYHKKCLPKKIALEEDEDTQIEKRAWEGLLVDRILIYCLKHKIDEDLGTPARDHIQFNVEDKENETLAEISARKKASSKKMPALRAPSQSPLPIGSKKRTFVDGDHDNMDDIRALKLQRSNKSKKLPAKLNPVAQSSGIHLKDSVGPIENEILKEVESTKLSKDEVEMFGLDSDSEEWILNLMKEATSSITLDDIIRKHEELISRRSYKQIMEPCKSITLRKAEGYCKAVREAAKKLDKRSGVKETESICGSTILNHMVKWKGKLSVYLAPFLHGTSYTSFGRLFTKYEKLKEIADILHWYVNDKDTIVDFCCGANDFSLLVKERLENRCKKCFFKNYDIFRPKNDFCFEKRDWMEVKTDELPTGSKLIMGISPPVGVNAYQFIKKAIEFKPKLIILIVPSEIGRLDKMDESYDLILEDKDKLSGKSFYLPGCYDVNGKQMEDWDVGTPILSVWSRTDWTSKHLEIAKKYQHLPRNQTENFFNGTPSFNNHSSGSKPTESENSFPYTLIPECTKEVEETQKKSSHKGDHVDKHISATQENIKTKESSKYKNQQEVKHVPNKPHHQSREQREVSGLRQSSVRSWDFESSYNPELEMENHPHDGVRPSNVSRSDFSPQNHSSHSLENARSRFHGYGSTNHGGIHLGQRDDHGFYHQGQGPPKEGNSAFAQRPNRSYPQHPMSLGGWIDG